MPLDLPAMPSFQTNIPQMPSSLDQYGKMLQLKALQGQQAMQPLQQQEAQQQIQASALDIQQKQNLIDSQEAAKKAVSDGVLMKYIGKDAGNDSGVDGNGMWADLVKNYKVLPDQASQMVDSLLKRSQTMAETAKTVAQTGEANATVRAKGWDALHERVADALAQSGDKQIASLTSLTQDLIKHPWIFDGVPKDDLGHVFNAAKSGNLVDLKIQAGAIQIDKKLAEHQTDQANAAAAQYKQQQEQIAAQGGQTDETKQQLIKEKFIQNAENVRQSYNRAAMQSNELQKSGLSQLDKMFTDPQHGYAQFLAQANSTKSALAEAKDGNELAASLAPLMTVLGVNSFAGIHRVNPQEIAAAGTGVGSLYRRANTILDKATTGKMNDDTRKEMGSVIDGLISAKHASLVPSANLVVRNAGLDPAKTSVLDKDGGMTTLDKLGSGAQKDFFSQFGGKPK